MNFYHLLALGSGPGGAEGSQGGGLGSMVFLFASLIFVWWFIYLGPQMKKQKQRDAMLGGIKKSDRVVTRGGIIGTVVGVKEKEKIVVLRISSDVKVEVVQSAIETIVSDKAEETK